jgi:hypothetical protein
LTVVFVTATLGLSAVGMAAVSDVASPLARITGTDRADVLRGGAASDVVDGRGGNDVLNGRGGNDVLYGREGNDRLIGGAGSDQIVCGPGRDTVSADRLDTVARDCEVVKGAAPPPRTVPEPLVGVWKRAITFGPAFDDSWDGVWTITFDRLGFLETQAPAGAAGLVAKSTTLVSATVDGQLVVGTSPRCLSTGLYRWEVADAVLKIRVVSEPAECNRQAVYSGDWTR